MSRVAFFLVMLVAYGCSDSAKPATQVLLSIGASGAATSADTVRVRVLGGLDGELREQRVVDLPIDEWPVELALDPRSGDADRQWQVEAWALSNEEALGAGTVTGGFDANALVRKSLVLKPGVNLGPVPGATHDGGPGDDGGLDAGDGSASSDPCASDNGGCDPLVTCAVHGDETSCGSCPARYEDIKGNGTLCEDIDECAEDNGGCGEAARWTCVNEGGAPPTCEDVDECATDNGGCGDDLFFACENVTGGPPNCEDIDECADETVCTSDYPCRNLSPSYTCRGQFADWAPDDSPSAFVVNTDGTVSDTRTGLTWQRAVSGTYSHAAGVSYCAGLSLAGGGWRLPTRAEIESLVDFTKTNPTINSTAFPNTPAEHYWTASSQVGLDGYAWLVPFFVPANTGSHIVTDPYRVRCVRSAESVSPSQGSGGAPPLRYTVGNDTVEDRFTGLTWQRSVAATSYDVAGATSYCASLALDGATWRLPSISELMTLVDSTSHEPTIDVSAFPNTPRTFFWSSSVASDSASRAWNVNFDIGFWISYQATEMHRVRCVH